MSSSVARSRTVCLKYYNFVICLCQQVVCLLLLNPFYELHGLVEMRIDRALMYDVCHILRKKRFVDAHCSSIAG